MKDLIRMALKVRIVIRAIVILIFITNCSSNKKAIVNNEVLNYIIKKSNGNIYYKTIIKEGNIPIESYIKSKYLEFYLCVPKINAPIKIDENTIRFLKQEFKSLKIERLDRISLDSDKKITEKNMRLKTSFITVPVLFKNNTMAIYYSKETYGGSFNLLQKKEGKWEQICSSSVWIE